MSVELFECDQGTDAWYRARMGIPTASEFATVLAKGRDGGASLTRRKYLCRLAGEIVTGEPETTYMSAHMERGKVMEAEARDLYCFLTDAELRRVGFVRRGNYGCSPDSLIGEDGGLEIKTALPSILIEYILADKFPAEHVAQCQGNMFVTGRKWWDIAVYWPKMPLFVKRLVRDEAYHERLILALHDFTNELGVIVSRLGKS